MAAGLLSGGSPTPRAMEILSLSAFPGRIYIPPLARPTPSPRHLSRRPGALMETKITDRVKQILSWYSSENPGTLTNLARLLTHGRLGGTRPRVPLPGALGLEAGPAASLSP